MRQARFQIREELEEKFQNQIQALKKFSWENSGLMIRPPKSQEEVGDEGEALRHAVICYLGKMSEGATAILFIRRVSEPDKPFFTLELNPKTLKVVQCCTKHNASYVENPEVMEFVETWVKEVVWRV
ncbi:PcfJ-like protein [anaerobic digester metagenome]